MIEKWAQDAKECGFPKLNNINYFIPIVLNTDFFIEMMNLLDKQILKRVYLELRLVKLFDKNYNLTDATNAIIDKVNSNAANWYQ